MSAKHGKLNYVHSSPSLSPALLDQLQSSTAEVKRKLSPEEGGCSVLWSRWMGLVECNKGGLGLVSRSQTTSSPTDDVSM